MISSSAPSPSIHSPSFPHHNNDDGPTATTRITCTSTLSKTKWVLVFLFGFTWLNLGSSSRQLRLPQEGGGGGGVVAPPAVQSSIPKDAHTTRSVLDFDTPLRNESTTTATTTTPWTSTLAQQPPRFWVIVPWYSEGISGWMISLAELLVFCKTYNATFVLPHINQGRLTTTTKTTKRNMPVLDLFDSTLIQQYHSALATIHDYRNNVTRSTLANNDNNSSSNNSSNVKLFSICMTYWQGVCNYSEMLHQVSPGSYGPQEGQGVHSKTLEAALQWTKEYPNDVVVLELNQYLVHSLSKKYFRQNNTKSRRSRRNSSTIQQPATTTATATATKLISDNEVNHVMQSVLQFHPKIETLATVALQHLGIAPHEPYLTFHWRAERENLDYMKCAQALVESKNLVLSHYNKTMTPMPTDRSDNTATMPVILLSSLNTNPALEWAGAKQLAYNTSAPHALVYLVQPVEEGGGGFLKLDSVLSQVLQQFASQTTRTPTTTMTTTTDNPPDMIVTVVLDLIIAIRSHQFVTCTKACINSFCNECNVLTKFGNFTMTLRQRRQEQERRQGRQYGQVTQLSDSTSTPATVNRDADLALVDPINHNQDYQCWPMKEQNENLTNATIS